MPSYPGISSAVFRHPQDREAEQALRNVPGFDLLSRSFVDFFYDRPQNIYLLGNAVQVGPRQYSTLYNLFRRCAQDLDVRPEPQLFVSNNSPSPSYSLGYKKPQIVLSGYTLDILSEDELRVVIASELGHIKCEHNTLMQMGIWALSAASTLGEMTFGLGNLLSSGLLYAFYEWRRKAELSSDRAALLLTDSPEIVLQTMMKIAGGSREYAHEVNLEEFVRQAENYQELDQDSRNQIYKFLLFSGGYGSFLSHPFPVERIPYLQEWSTSQEYVEIRQGNYSHVPTQGSVEVEANQVSQELEELQQEIKNLQEEIEQLKNPKKDN